jgi:murein DD-endopeptidase MepM/ murein hydrolase activator NlpD
MSATRLLVTALLVALLFLTTPDVQVSNADHVDFYLKFPWQDGATRTVTRAFGVASHVGSAYYSLDFATPTSDSVRAAHEGAITFWLTSLPCDPQVPPGEPPNTGLGNFVVLQGTTPANDTWYTSYAHLSSIRAEIISSAIAFAYQGTHLGHPGDTGWTEASEGQACGIHLHFTVYNDWPCGSFACAQDPGQIEGEASFSENDSFTSTNAIIGDEDIDANAANLMVVDYGLFNGWHTVGYVSNIGRGLPMHRHGGGWEQNFRNHDGPSGIYVPDSVGNDAFWVLPEFWPHYETVLGGATGFLKYPITEQVLPCPPGAPSPCDTYQEFECGLMWRNGSTLLSQTTCGYEGLYGISTSSGGTYRHLEFGAGSWQPNASYTPPSGSRGLKVFGEFMIHNAPGGQQAFWVSTDAGETWEQAAKPDPASPPWVPIDADLCPDGRLWLAWQASQATQYNRVRLYYSDDFGATITQSAEINISGLSGYAAHFNGALSCHATDPNRVAVIVQRGSSARVIVTANGGGNWAVRSVGNLANAYRMVWGGDRLLVIADIGSVARVYYSDDDGQSWDWGEPSADRHKPVQ